MPNLMRPCPFLHDHTQFVTQQSLFLHVTNFSDVNFVKRICLAIFLSPAFFLPCQIGPFFDAAMPFFDMTMPNLMRPCPFLRDHTKFVTRQILFLRATNFSDVNSVKRICLAIFFVARSFFVACAFFAATASNLTRLHPFLTRLRPFLTRLHLF
ncbi:hypothetical protein XENTR_v10023359 [Xenopus tropicalis]|nr:hypothetical protein XENTR_v10023359 [Xenopus tropicalis]